MSDFDTAQIKQQAFGTQKIDTTPPETAAKQIEDLSDTVTHFKLDEVITAKPKRSVRLQTPEKTLAAAIEEGVSAKELHALQTEWKAYTRQQARLLAHQNAKAEEAALQKELDDGRRKVADELLKLADGYGVSMKVARDIFKDALEANKKAKGKGK